MSNEEFISINKVAEAKGLKSNRSLRLEINKPESKYVAREVKVNGGTSYEILYSSLEPEIQQKLRENNTKSTALVPLNYQPTTFVSESARLTSLARLDIVKALLNDACEKAIMDSLEKLQVEYIDMVLLHWHFGNTYKE